MSFQMKKVVGLPAQVSSAMGPGRAWEQGTQGFPRLYGWRVCEGDSLKKAAGTEGNEPLPVLTYTCFIWYLWRRERPHLTACVWG